MQLDYFDLVPAVERALGILEAMPAEVAGNPAMTINFQESDLAEICRSSDDWAVLCNRLSARPGIELGEPCRYTRRGPRIRQAIAEERGRAMEPFFQNGGMLSVNLPNIVARSGESPEHVMEELRREIDEHMKSQLPWNASASIDQRRGDEREPLPYPATPLVGLYERCSELLGSGGTGRVAAHRVCHRTTWAAAGQRVAIKIVPEFELFKVSPNRDAGRERLLREFFAGRRHNSSRLVKTHDIFHVDIHEASLGGPQPVYGLAMDLVEGKPLSEACAQEPSRSKRLRYSLQLAEAVADLHAIRFVHRDIKPQNAMLRDSTDSVVLVDLGISKSANDDTLTATGERVCTPLYAAPGQLSDAREERFEDDIYSLGVSIFELVEGARPFAETHRERLLATKEGGPLQVGDLETSDPEFARLLQAMTAPIRAARPSIADACATLRGLAAR
jgi:serine/threonine protein kinase